MNIKPKFVQRIKLPTGKYVLKISCKYYETLHKIIFYLCSIVKHYLFYLFMDFKKILIVKYTDVETKISVIMAYIVRGSILTTLNFIGFLNLKWLEIIILPKIFLI